MREATRAPSTSECSIPRDAVGDVMAEALKSAQSLLQRSAGARSRTLRTLAVSASERLSGLFERAPTWAEQGIDCVIGRGAASTCKRARARADCILGRHSLAATSSAEWNAQLAQYYWTRMYCSGAGLREYLQRERAQLSAGLAELGMLQ